jgi:hypothetical protein
MLAGQRVLFPLLLLLVVQACAELEPQSFSRGQAIPIAAWTVKVNRVEVLSSNALPATTIQLFQSGEKLLAVHVRLEYEGVSEEIPPDFASLLRSVTLEDETGERWKLRIGSVNRYALADVQSRRHVHPRESRELGG